MNTTTKTKRSAKHTAFVPAAWQWDPAQIAGGQTGRVQLWSAAGSLMAVVPVAEARALIAKRAFFIGSDVHACQANG